MSVLGPTRGGGKHMSLFMAHMRAAVTARQLVLGPSVNSDSDRNHSEQFTVITSERFQACPPLVLFCFLAYLEL